MAQSNSPWATAWVTGASSGIGYELARKLAASGVRVAVSARSADKLADLAKTSPLIVPFPVDVSDRAAVAATVDAILAQFGSLDLAVLNAGVWHPIKGRTFDATKVMDAINVNFGGCVYALEKLCPLMTSRRSGQMAFVASVAGYRGLPTAAGYAPSKAALISLAECLRNDLERHGVYVSVINPGFVETPMTSVNKFPMPFMIKADDAAQRIIDGLKRRRFEIAFPWPMVAMMKALRLMPNWLYLWWVRTAIISDDSR